MTLSQKFPAAAAPDFYILGDTGKNDMQRTAFLNRLAALTPVNETDPVRLNDLHELTMDTLGFSRAPSHLGPQVVEAFDLLVTKARGTTRLDANHNVCAMGAVQNQILDAFKSFNEVVQKSVTPLILTAEGRKFFGDCERARSVYLGMSHGGLSGTTYAPSYNRS